MLKMLPSSTTEQGTAPHEAPLSSRQRLRQETQARLNRQWLQRPQDFDPSRTSRGRLRLKRIEDCLLSIPITATWRVADLGCGQGHVLAMLQAKGAEIYGIDASSIALKRARQLLGEKAELSQAVLPDSSLADHSFDLVVTTDLLSELAPRDHRLFVSELARLLKKEAQLVLSVDLRVSSDALSRLHALLSTEFELTAQRCSYHRLGQALERLMLVPKDYYEASRKSQYRSCGLLKQRRGFPRLWYRLQSHPVSGRFWGWVSAATTPLYKRLAQSERLCILLERLSRWLWDADAITHVILIGKKRQYF